MAETFSFYEGELHLWTGSHTASGNPVAYVENVNITPNIAWQSDAAVDGTYRAHITDERADYSFSVAWEYGATLPILHAARTAVHMKITHDLGGGLGSAGVILYSGVLNTVGYGGAQRGMMQLPVNGFAHSWSAF
jgi:hypothetical protein